jgi:hypothetical protein
MRTPMGGKKLGDFKKELQEGQPKDLNQSNQ